MGSFSKCTVGVATIFALGWAGNVLACQPTVTVQSGDNLFSIAEEQLGDMSQWSAIFYANPKVQGGSLLDIDPGTVLRIPCPGAADHAPIPTPQPVAEPEPKPEPAIAAPQAAVTAKRPDVDVRLLVRSNYPPFADQTWPEQGMLSELVQAIFSETPDPVTHAVSWEDDWSRQLFPMLDDKEFDLGFPWFKPDCDSDPSKRLCTNFHFSDPLIDVVILLFARSDTTLPFEVDSDLHGRRLCRPAGHFTHDLDRPDRLWLTRGLITLVQPLKPEDCFNMLMAGEVDAVTLNEFLGVQKMFELGLTEMVTPLERPVSVEGLHAVISKTHWRGTTHLYRFNAGLAKLRQSARYNEIVSRHLAQFWDQIKS
ncbi:MAG: transporter substrate-binding domain-containing protein [Tateyamaria sp.]|uniref:ABC transporter substrate-binding protein n=1 Tax=Tateyamaria sp. TaxID=1929288 RepID=UPI00329F75F9